MLTRHQIDFAKTRDLRWLLALLQDAEPESAARLQAVRWREPFGVEIRYPGDRLETLPGDELRARELAQMVRVAVMNVLDLYLAGD